MKPLLTILLCLQLSNTAFSQTLYYPPLIGDTWDTLSPASLGWCEEEIEALYNMLDEHHTKAFVVLKGGKIVLEKYFGSFEQDSLWYWASAGKSLTAFLIGLAQQEGYVHIEDSTSHYLGTNWTFCTPEQESKITVRHQLTMTSGLDDKVPDPYCTLDSCLLYLADAGTRWAYHNAPYTLLDEVIQTGAGQSLNLFFQERMRFPTGMTGLFLPIGYNTVFFSHARSMARFGLLMLGNGNWNGKQIMTDTDYFNQMIHTSQDLNQSYGYLWWLNGQSSFMLPGLQFVFPGSLIPNAPDDMYAALGKNGQYLNVVPGEELVIVRMGDAPDSNEVSIILNDLIWEHLNGLICGSTASGSAGANSLDITIMPNPVTDYFSVYVPGAHFSVQVYDLYGRLLHQEDRGFEQIKVHWQGIPGVYLVRVMTGEHQVSIRKICIL